MAYDEELDEWIFAKGERLVFVYERKEPTDNGYVTSNGRIVILHVPDARFKTHAPKAKTRKPSIRVSLKNQQQRQEIRERLFRGLQKLPWNGGLFVLPTI